MINMSKKGLEIRLAAWSHFPMLFIFSSVEIRMMVINL